MRVVGFVTEYNPFHLGHKHHLEMSKKLTDSNFSIAVLSGSFVQRGEPSFIDKWTKARIAIDNGVDLVIELPTIFSIQSAEYFAYGGVKLLNSLNIIDCISFGSESGKLDDLDKIAQILVEEPLPFKNKLRIYLNEGHSFAASRSNALVDYFYEFKPQDKFNTKGILRMSNNILAIEYLKALKLINSKMKPITLKRIGSSYSDEHLSHKIASATSIRKNVFKGNIESIKNYITPSTYHHLVSYINRYKVFNSINNYRQIIHYLLKVDDGVDLSNIMGVEEGLENRIINKSNFFYNIEDLVEEISTRRYPKTRIQRILVNLMLGLTDDTFKALYEKHPCYVRVLGTNKKGFLLLKKIKENSPIPILTKFSDYKKYNNSNLKQILSFDKKATDLFFLGVTKNKPSMNMDYYTSPYVKKD